MKILLLEDVKGLGKKGEICEVKDGYGKNFLIAKNKAKHATNEVIKRYQAQLRQQEEKLALEIAEKKQFVQTLSQITLKIAKKVGKNNSLFGAITKEDIAETLLRDYALEINKKDIEIKAPIKALGDYEVEIKLGNQINANLKIQIIAQD